jgi:pimeloyl-ACP methyl ester carboxylesterase
MVAARPEIQGNSVRANVCDPTRQLRAQAHAIRAPVLMVHPTGDRVVPIVYAENLRDLLVGGGADVTFFATEGGHVAHVTHAPAVNEIVTRWVRERL